MVTRAVERGELPKGTDPRLLLSMVGAALDAWTSSSSGQLKVELLDAAVRTVVIGARSGSLVRSQGRGGSTRSVKRSTPRASKTARYRSSKQASLGKKGK